MKILITEKIAEVSIQYLRNRGFDVDVLTGRSYEEICGFIAPYDALIVRSATRVDRGMIDAAANMKVIGRAGNGVDNIDVDACTAKGIIAVNTPEANIMAAAEMAIALAFTVFRHVAEASEASHNDDFRRANFVGNELEGKTAGVIGLGRIGAIVARKLKGIGMDVIGYDAYLSDARFQKLGVIRCETLEELLGKSDLITLHMPKTRETYNMIDAPQLALCKKGVRIINAARGGMVNEKALYDALVSGQVAGAGIDVLDHEPDYNSLPGVQHYENALLTHPNCVVTPHLGASTHEANANVGNTVTELVADALDGELIAAINMPAISGSLSEMKPYINLASKLGAIYYQAEKSRVWKIEIIYSGDLAEAETGLLTLSVLKGFVSTVAKERISFVNVKSHMDVLGVEVEESKNTQLERYNSLITVKFYSEEKDLSVSGTIFGKDSEVLVDFFGYHMDFELAPYVLALQNNDVPGVIGRIGTILGKNDVNIASMHWGRKKDKMRAQAFISVDSPIDNDLLNQLGNVDGVLRVSFLQF